MSSLSFARKSVGKMSLTACVTYERLVEKQRAASSVGVFRRPCYIWLAASHITLARRCCFEFFLVFILKELPNHVHVMHTIPFRTAGIYMYQHHIIQAMFTLTAKCSLKKILVSSIKETGAFTTNLSTKGIYFEFQQNKHHLNHMMSQTD